MRSSARLHNDFRLSRKRALPLAAALFSTFLAVITLAGRGARARSTHGDAGANLGGDGQSLTPTARALDELRLDTTVRAAGFALDFCNGPSPTNYLGSSNRAWLALLLPLTVFCFVGLAVVTDDYFVPALEVIVDTLGVSPDVAGATFMAAGSSAPELFTSLLAVFVTKDDVGVGTIVGSAVFNILVIIGVSALFAPPSLRLDPRLLFRDAVWYAASAALLLVFVMFSTRGHAHWWEGLIFLVGYVAYILFLAFGNKPYLAFAKKFVDPGLISESDAAASAIDMEGQAVAVANDTSPVPNGAVAVDLPDNTPAANDTAGNITAASAEHLSKLRKRSTIRGNMKLPGDEDLPKILGVPKPTSKLGWSVFPVIFVWKLLLMTTPDCKQERWKKYWWATFTLSIIWVMGISYVMVEAARLSGCYIGIPSSVMGLTVLAAGTSVPDALASISVVRRGDGNMAVSNAIGSNVFDILIGLGLPWFLAGLILKKPQEITVTPIGQVVIPIAILFAIVIALVVIMIALKWKLSKMLGWILFGLYGAFVTYSLLDVFVFNKQV